MDKIVSTRLDRHSKYTLDETLVDYGGYKYQQYQKQQKS